MLTLFSSTRSRFLRIVALVALVILVLALFVLGAQPFAVKLIPEPYDKVAHWLLFTIFAALTGLASGLLPLQRNSILLLAFFCTLTVGAADELHQSFLPGRAAGWDDFAADSVGSICGLWLLVTLKLVR